MNQFKRAQVIMLPTKVSNIYKDKLNKLWYWASPTLETSIAQHLYIISDDEIKEGDWTLCLDEIDSTAMNWNINQCIFKYSKGGNCTQCKKIIATTDTSIRIKNEIGVLGLMLPQPSQQFIEKYIEVYNQSNIPSNNISIITDVLVEYKEIRDEKYWNPIEGKLQRFNILIPKVNPKDNTITIKKLKDSWSREELIKLMNIAYLEGSLDGNNKTFDELIKDNL